MTGFAHCEGRYVCRTPFAWQWEARSVNGKGLDVRVKLPAGFESVDAQVRQTVTRALGRGHVSIVLSIITEPTPEAYQVNNVLLDHLLSIAAEKAKSMPVGVAPARLDGLLAVKGVLEVDQASVRDVAEREVRDEALIGGLVKTVAALAAAREAEGARLEPNILELLSEIEALKEAASELAAIQPEKIRERLRLQVSELLSVSPALPEDRLIQEAAVLAVKVDVREELDRLSAHVSQARVLLDGGSPCGRRLDFLSQELNREANTLCAKSQDTDLTRIGLDLKAKIDQFREQIQNIE